jgi:hypothetical protein
MNNNDIAFFIGLLEGDGSIQVNHWREKYLQFRVVVKLKYSEKNHEMLSDMRNQLDMFNIHVRNNCVLLVEDDQQKLKKFIKLVNLFGGLLLTKCRKRFCFFEYALVNKITVLEYTAIKSNPTWFGYNNIKPFNVNELINRACFNDWLIGFFEAESCFCIRKNNNHSFSIGQKGELEVINAIKHKFLMPNKVQCKSNDFFLIETYNRACLNRIITFCDNKLKGQKHIQYLEFSKISVVSKLHHMQGTLKD